MKLHSCSTYLRLHLFILKIASFNRITSNVISMIFFVSQMITYSCQLKSFSCSEHRITTALHPFAEPCSFPYQKWLASTLVVVSTLSMSSWCLLLSTSISSLISLMNLFASLSHLLMSVSKIAKLASVSTIS